MRGASGVAVLKTERGAMRGVVLRHRRHTTVGSRRGLTGLDHFTAAAVSKRLGHLAHWPSRTRAVGPGARVIERRPRSVLHAAYVEPPVSALVPKQATQTIPRCGQEPANHSTRQRSCLAIGRKPSHSAALHSTNDHSLPSKALRPTQGWAAPEISPNNHLLG